MFSIGKFIVTAAGIAAIVGLSQKSSASEPAADDPAPDPEPAPTVAYVNGAEEGQALPLVVVLHADGSSPSAAIDLIRPPLGMTGAARIIAPAGRYGSGNTRFFVNPNFKGVSYWIALRKELTRLGEQLETFVTEAPMPAPPRAMIVGLGSGGALAIGLGLQMPIRVRQAWGVGGAVPSSWVPLAMPALNNMQRPTLRKITYGEAVETDNATAKLAQSRGADFSLMQVAGPPDMDTVRKWIIADLDLFLNTP